MFSNVIVCQQSKTLTFNRQKLIKKILLLEIEIFGYNLRKHCYIFSICEIIIFIFGYEQIPFFFINLKFLFSIIYYLFFLQLCTRITTFNKEGFLFKLA